MNPLRYGAQKTLELHLPERAIVTRCDLPRGTALADVATAVDRALGEPLDFPPLAQSVVPLDKVVLALAADVPQTATIVERVTRLLIDNGVRGEDITLVLAAHPAASSAPAGVPALADAAIVQAVHDPHHRDALSYLATSADGHAIYINRAIHDADLVISIGCLRLAESPGYHGIHGDVFPTFSDAASIGRYQSPRSGATRRQKRAAQAAEVSWLLGASFTIQVVPGAGDDVLHVLAGDAEAVTTEGNRLCEAAWLCEVASPVDLVIATLDGPGEQTWLNVGRALAAASGVLSDEGSVVLCTDLEELPGPAVQRLTGAEDLDGVLAAFAKHRSPDVPAAAELVRALQRGKVYLISQLDEELVEELGLSPLGPSQLARVVGRHESWLVLGGAQRAVARVSSESALPMTAGRARSRE